MTEDLKIIQPKLLSSASLQRNWPKDNELLSESQHTVLIILYGTSVARLA